MELSEKFIKNSDDVEFLRETIFKYEEETYRFLVEADQDIKKIHENRFMIGRGYEHYTRYDQTYQDHDFMSITAIVPNWTRDYYVPYMVNHFLYQDYPRELIEIIFVDQNSPQKEELQETCKWFAQNNKDVRMRYFQHYDDPLKNGIIRKNTGIRYAQNDITILSETDGIIIGNDYFKQASWAHTQVNKLYLKALSTGIGGIPDIGAGPADSWLPNSLLDGHLLIDRRAEHPVGESLKTKGLQEVEGCPETSYGWGGVESKMHLVMAERMDVKLCLCPHMLTITLPNFCGEPMLPKSEWGPTRHNPTHPKQREGKEWGIGDGMEEINLYE